MFLAQRAGKSSRWRSREIDQGTWGRALKDLALGPKTELFGSSEHEEALVKETEKE